MQKCLCFNKSWALYFREFGICDFFFHNHPTFSRTNLRTSSLPTSTPRAVGRSRIWVTVSPCWSNKQQKPRENSLPKQLKRQPRARNLFDLRSQQSDHELHQHHKHNHTANSGGGGWECLCCVGGSKLRLFVSWGLDVAKRPRRCGSSLVSVMWTESDVFPRSIGWSFFF